MVAPLDVLTASNTSSSTLRIPVARAYLPFLRPSRYKAAYGGRGSGKTHFFGGQAVNVSYGKPTRIVCIREVQNTLQDSIKQLITNKIHAFGLAGSFEITDREIRGPSESLMIFRGMQQYNAESIKSLEGFDIALIVEAQALSQRSLDLLRPTIRNPGSEIWAEWNPENDRDAIDKFFRGAVPPEDAIIRRVNWSDNPWFPDELRKEMERDRKADPAKAAHIWDGDYQAAPKGAYYAELLAQALAEGRIGNVPHDPILQTYVSVDLGNGPNMALWFAQWVGREVRIIDYLQGDDDAANEGWPWYIRKLRAKKYDYAKIILPHDARARQRVNGKGDEKTLIEAGFETHVVERMNPGERAKLVQRYLPLCWFDEGKCEKEGLKALKSYQSDYDEKMHVDRGPLHNWASHPADSFGHMIQAYEEPSIPREEERVHHGAGGWMS